MGKIILSFGLFIASQTVLTQVSTPNLLLDGLLSGSVYEDSVGILSLSGDSNYKILSFTMTINDNSMGSAFRMSKNEGEVGQLIHVTPSGSKITIRAKIGCLNCIQQTISSDFYAP